MHELLYHVREHCNAADKPFLPSCGGRTWKYVCGADLPDDRRRHQADSDDGRDASACELRRKFAAQYDDYVCDRTGAVYAAAG